MLRPPSPPKGYDWRADAGCRGKDTEIFFPKGDDSEEQHPERVPRRYLEARRICWNDCPVREKCLDYAMHVERGGKFRYGIWGGYVPIERDRLSRGIAVMLEVPTEAEAV